MSLVLKIHARPRSKESTTICINYNMTPKDVIQILRVEKKKMQNSNYGLMISKIRNKCKWISENEELGKMVIDDDDIIFTQPYHKLITVELPDQTCIKRNVDLRSPAENVVKELCYHFNIYPYEIWGAYIDARGENILIIPNQSISEQAPDVQRIYLKQYLFPDNLYPDVLSPFNMYIYQYRSMIVQEQFGNDDEDQIYLKGKSWYNTKNITNGLPHSEASRKKELEDIFSLKTFGSVSFIVRFHETTGKENYHLSEKLKRLTIVRKALFLADIDNCKSDKLVVPFSSIKYVGIRDDFIKITFGSKEWHFLSHRSSEIDVIICQLMKNYRFTFPLTKCNSDLILPRAFHSIENQVYFLPDKIYTTEELIQENMAILAKKYAKLVNLRNENDCDEDYSLVEISINSSLDELMNAIKDQNEDGDSLKIETINSSIDQAKLINSVDFNDQSMQLENLKKSLLKLNDILNKENNNSEYRKIKKIIKHSNRSQGNDDIKKAPGNEIIQNTNKSFSSSKELIDNAQDEDNFDKENQNMGIENIEKCPDDLIIGKGKNSIQFVHIENESNQIKTRHKDENSKINSYPNDESEEDGDGSKDNSYRFSKDLTGLITFEQNRDAEYNNKKKEQIEDFLDKKTADDINSSSSSYQKNKNNQNELSKEENFLQFDPIKKIPNEEQNSQNNLIILSQNPIKNHSNILNNDKNLKRDEFKRIESSEKDEKILATNILSDKSSNASDSSANKYVSEEKNNIIENDKHSIFAQNNSQSSLQLLVESESVETSDENQMNIGKYEQISNSSNHQKDICDILSSDNSEEQIENDNNKSEINDQLIKSKCNIVLQNQNDSSSEADDESSGEVENIDLDETTSYNLISDSGSANTIIDSSKQNVSYNAQQEDKPSLNDSQLEKSKLITDLNIEECILKFPKQDQINSQDQLDKTEVIAYPNNNMEKSFESKELKLSQTEMNGKEASPNNKTKTVTNNIQIINSKENDCNNSIEKVALSLISLMNSRNQSNETSKFNAQAENMINDQQKKNIDENVKNEMSHEVIDNTSPSLINRDEISNDQKNQHQQVINDVNDKSIKQEVSNEAVKNDHVKDIKSFEITENVNASLINQEDEVNVSDKTQQNCQSLESSDVLMKRAEKVESNDENNHQNSKLNLTSPTNEIVENEQRKEISSHEIINDSNASLINSNEKIEITNDSNNENGKLNQQEVSNKTIIGNQIVHSSEVINPEDNNNLMNQNQNQKTEIIKKEQVEDIISNEVKANQSIQLHEVTNDAKIELNQQKTSDDEKEESTKSSEVINNNNSSNAFENMSLKSETNQNESVKSLAAIKNDQSKSNELIELSSNRQINRNKSSTIVKNDDNDYNDNDNDYDESESLPTIDNTATKNRSINRQEDIIEDYEDESSECIICSPLVKNSQSKNGSHHSSKTAVFSPTRRKHESSSKLQFVSQEEDIEEEQIMSFRTSSPGRRRTNKERFSSSTTTASSFHMKSPDRFTEFPSEVYDNSMSKQSHTLSRSFFRKQNGNCASESETDYESTMKEGANCRSAQYNEMNDQTVNNYYNMSVSSHNFYPQQQQQQQQQLQCLSPSQSLQPDQFRLQMQQQQQQQNQLQCLSPSQPLQMQQQQQQLQTYQMQSLSQQQLQAYQVQQPSGIPVPCFNQVPQQQFVSFNQSVIAGYQLSPGLYSPSPAASPNTHIETSPQITVNVGGSKHRKSRKANKKSSRKKRNKDDSDSSLSYSYSSDEADDYNESKESSSEGLSICSESDECETVNQIIEEIEKNVEKIVKKVNAKKKVTNEFKSVANLLSHLERKFDGTKEADVIHQIIKKIKKVLSKKTNRKQTYISLTDEITKAIDTYFSEFKIQLKEATIRKSNDIIKISNNNDDMDELQKTLLQLQNSLISCSNA